MIRQNAIYFLAFAAMAVGILISYYPPKDNGVVIWSMVSAFMGHVARDLFGAGNLSGNPTSSDEAPVNNQAGFARIGIMLALAIVAAFVMTGCASQLQAVAAFNQSAMTSIRSASDIGVDNVKAALCSTSLDTYSRHPELTDAAISLCLNPNSATSTQPTQAQALKTSQQGAAK